MVSSGTLVVCRMEGREGKIPVRAHDTDAGMDFFAPLDMERTEVKPQHDIKIHTGIRVAIPRGWAMLGVNKSGVATKKKLTLGAKLIDADYRGELIIHLVNIGSESTWIEPGEKIAQFVLLEVGTHMIMEFSEEDYMRTYAKTERGEGGFGSTGTV